jgi:putative transcriptional regulator
MNEQAFEELLESLREGGAILRGEKQPSRQFGSPDPDVKAIREATQLSQAEFALLIGVRLRTLQNWERKRIRPAGPARALLKIVAANPEEAIKVLHPHSY